MYSKKSGLIQSQRRTVLSYIGLRLMVKHIVAIKVFSKILMRWENDTLHNQDQWKRQNVEGSIGGKN